MGVDPKSVKSNETGRVICEDDADIWLIQEVGINWHAMASHERWSERTKKKWKGRTRATFAHNERENDGKKHQPGGVGIIAKGSMIGRQSNAGKDSRRLGRWVWTEFKGRQDKRIRVVSSYRPTRNKQFGTNTVHEQQSRTLVKDGLTNEPREIILEELTEMIKSWNEQRILTIIGMDANQNVTSKRMKRFADEAGLVEGIITFREKQPLISTCVKNNSGTPIDGLWITPNITIKRAGYCEPDEKICSDHIALWMDLDFIELLGKPDKTARPCIRSLLNEKDYKSKKKYLTQTKKCQKDANRLEQLRALQVIPMERWTGEQEKQFNAILQKDVSQRRELAAKTRTKYTGTKMWSPSLQQLRDRRRLWSLVIKLKAGNAVKSNAIRRLMKKTKEPDALKKSLAEAKQEKKEVDKEYGKSDEEWEKARFEFIKEMDKMRAREKGISRRGETKSRISIERQRKVGRLIAQLKGKKKVKISNLIARDKEGNIKDLKNCQEMESACIDSNIRRFTQANGTEATSKKLIEEVGYLAEKEGAKQILAGTYNTEGLSKYMKELITELERFPTAYRMDNIVLSREEHQRGWRKQKINTGSDSRGLSYSHYKIAATDPTIAEVDALLRSIPYEKGFSPTLWKKVTDFQLLKKEGIFEVDLMRTIQLYMSDFNMNNKRLGRDVVAHAEALRYLPEELTGSRKGKMASITILNKILINDLWRLRRIAAALCSTDAKSCYDRVIHWIAILAMRRIDVPVEPLRSMFTTIQQAVHSIAIENNLSEESYDGQTIEPPLHGLGQGNGAAPTIWLMVSAVIIHMLKKRGNGVQMMSAISQQVDSIVGFMFVDDLDLMDAAETPWSLSEDATRRMQATLDRWAGGLRATGGKLVPKKSYWYLIDFTWVKQEWKYVRARHQDQEVTIVDEAGKPTTLTKLDPSQARETLGIYTAADGNWRSELEKLKTLTKQVAARYRMLPATPNEIWDIFRTTTMKTWDYPKVAVNLTKAQWQEVTALILPTILSKANVPRTFPRQLVFAPESLQGLGLKNPWLDQKIVHIKTLLQEMQQASITGHLMTQVIEQLKLEIGRPGQLHHHNWTRIQSYLSPGWIQDLFNFCWQHDIELRETTASLRPYRDRDIAIMDIALAWSSDKKTLRRINNIRQAMQVTFLSELCTLDGSRISLESWDPTPNLRRKTQVQWPRTGTISKEDRRQWKLMLASMTRSKADLRLRHPLGRWWRTPERIWRYSTGTGRLYKQCHLCWESWSTVGVTGQQQVFRKIQGRVGLHHSLPTDAILADIVYGKKGVRLIDTLPIPRPVRLRTRTWWQDPRLIRSWTGAEALPRVARCIQQGTLIAVSDGSYKDNRAAAAFTIAERGHEAILVTGKAQVPCPGDSASPYRAEIFGFLSMMAWIEAVVDANQISKGVVHCGFDNESGTKRLTEPTMAGPDQADWDLVQVARTAMTNSKLRWEIFWVRGHQDETDKVLSQEEEMNVESDRLAKECWAETQQETQAESAETFKGECVSLFVHGIKQTTFDSDQIYQTLVEREVKEYWQQRHNITSPNTDQISWKTLAGAMKSLPQEIRRWSSKHFAGFSATGRVMHRRGEWDHDNCPACRQEEETAEHLWFCSSQLLQDKWTECQDNTQKYLEKIVTAPAICAVMHMIFPPNLGNPITQTQTSRAEWNLLEAQRLVGIENLFRGRVVQHWIDYQERWLRARATKWKRSSAKWAQRFVAHLLRMNWEVWRTRTDHLHNEKHPWKETERLETIQDIQRISADTSKFLSRDLPVIKRTLNRCENMSVDEAKRAVTSLQAAIQRKQAYDNSLQGPRSVMRKWLQSGKKKKKKKKKINK